MNKYYLPIGDWSNDGHGQCEKILIETAGTLSDIRETHFKIEETTGINIHRVANEYEDSTISSNTCLDIIKLGLNVSKYIGEHQEDLNENNALDKDYYYIDSDGIAELWVDLLNYTNNSLRVKIRKDEIEMIPFYGFDDKGRHIGFVGYGTLG